METGKRKYEHINICINSDVEAKKKTTGFEDIELIHRALPEISKSIIDVSCKLFNFKFSAPIIISSMTGGHPATEKINRALARAAGELNLAMGVGSQRAALEDPSLEYTYRVVREEAPNAFIIANIGAPQLAQGYGSKEAVEAIEMIDANALAVHLNPLQEIIQPEGEVDAHYYEGIKEICSEVSVPVIVKETGAGISMEDAEKLKRAGVAAIDVAGAGGTSWAGVEALRATQTQNETSKYLGETFWDWGIPTAISTIEVLRKVGEALTVISSGGIRTALDIAKALALGADGVGVALPLLPPAYVGGVDAVSKKLQEMMEGLRVTMFLVGVKNIEELQKAQMVITGKTAEWLRARGIDPTKL